MPDVRECLAHDVIHRSLALALSAPREALSILVCRASLRGRAATVPRSPSRRAAPHRAAPRHAAPCRAYALDSTRSLSFSTSHHTSSGARGSRRVGVIVFSSFPFFLFFLFYFILFFLHARFRHVTALCARAQEERGERGRERVILFLFFLFTNRKRLRRFWGAGFQHPLV